MLNTPIIFRIFILLAVWVSLISCSGGSGGYIESAIGSNAPTTAGESPEVRGIAAADLDGDGFIEIVATTSHTQSTAADGAQVFAFSRNGNLFQPPGLNFPAWSRYNNRTGTGGDAEEN